MKTSKLKIATISLKIVREPQRGYEPVSIRTPEDVYSFLQDRIGSSDKENFVVLMLDSQLRITGFQVVSTGTLSASLVHPREVFKAALLSNAHSILISHNHPSGITKPSPEDIQTTEQLIEAGKLLGVTVIDHIIVGRECLSLRETKPELWD